MKRIRIRCLAQALSRASIVGSCAVLASCSMSDRGPVQGQSFATNTEMRTLVGSCAPNSVASRPSDVDLRCGPLDLQLRDLTWTSWGAEVAKAHGTGSVEVPCAREVCKLRSAYVDLQVQVEVSDLQKHPLTWAGRPLVAQYQKVVISFPDSRPDILAPTVTVTLPAQLDDDKG